MRRWVPRAASLPSETQSDFTIGKTTPPARAVLLGMAGASSRSVTTKP